MARHGSCYGLCPHRYIGSLPCGVPEPLYWSISIRPMFYEAYTSHPMSIFTILRFLSFNYNEFRNIMSSEI